MGASGWLSSLRTRGILWVLIASLASGGATWLWMSSATAWQTHLSRAEQAGLALYYTLRDGGPAPTGIRLSPLPPDQAALAETGAFAALTDAPKPTLLTFVTLSDKTDARPSTPTLSVAILSSDIRYSVSDLQTASGPDPAASLARLTRNMATYCSKDLLVVARYGDRPWQVIEASGLLSCAAAPNDLRLPALALLALALIALLSSVAETASHFQNFARALGRRRRLPDGEAYDISGPTELRDIQMAVNAYLERERAALAQRATMLSGVSHDLGTPATRLRLRTALIENTDLREKLDADIDKMTGMIESVLTFTRSELSTEPPRLISLLSLVESVAADYQDMGQPVTLAPFSPPEIDRTGSVFASRRKGGPVTPAKTHSVLVAARPISLNRALSNLIDNALKYGRHAQVSLKATSSTASIIIEDGGSDVTADTLTRLIAPFKRGPNAQNGDGFGLGLTIVATIAEQHGGTLRFERGLTGGMRAVLTIERSPA
ncbi:MAG TPA: HAMP domain-containing histidine kinase [Aliiroseovarius sp.]|nr:HAMP domain-containing histidine kinase [Aliiroseovarius sp.]